jgi:ATP-dependent helicase Lhr and Lhr-like helicase
VIRRSADGDLHWWTWAGSAANRTLHASLGDLVDQRQRIGDQALRLRHGDDLRTVAAAMTMVSPQACTAPAVDSRAVVGLKFSAALPVTLAEATVAGHVGDANGARRALDEPRVLHNEP